ncbi:MAG: hypothetical protein GX786_10800 [Clostridiales bacterium]|nr:hypothetical protein [Clostridiales bacterium]
MVYSTVEKADAYFKQKIEHSSWEKLAQEEKQQSLFNASENITLYATLHGGFREVFDQANVPKEIERLCHMEALHCFEESKNERFALQRQNVTSITVGKTSESYKAVEMKKNEGYSYDLLPAVLTPYLKGQAMSGVIV